ncbi:recombinase family protein [Catalinimonas alkaloidigena]|nr:recombinase family protein [Catalinimonas alkaloidigena]
MPHYIAYYRVSTEGQGRSGLGLSAQRQAVRHFLKAGDELIEEFTEVESGKRDDRRQLEAAIRRVRERSATLLIAKLDRLSRSAGFIFRLRDAGVPFVCADLPEANTLTIGIFAALAQHERELIGQRTCAALMALKEKGVPLGSPQNLTEEAILKGQQIRQENARQHLANRQAAALIAMYRPQGLTFRQIAAQLNELGYRSRRGQCFGPATVYRLWQRHQEEAKRRDGNDVA